MRLSTTTVTVLQALIAHVRSGRSFYVSKGGQVCHRDADVNQSKRSAKVRLPSCGWRHSTERFTSLSAEDVVENLVNAENALPGAGGVFYNRDARVNRDLSVLMANILAEEREREVKGITLKTSNDEDDQQTSCIADADPTERHAKDAGVTGDFQGLTVLDAFSASGVRALRYLTEVPGVRRVVANDIDDAAIKMIRRAAEHCGVQDRLEVKHGDALDTMYAARAGGMGTYDIVDIDPYGCAAGYLDAGVQAVKDGGLLCITSTDLAILSGVQPTVAFSRYGSVPTRAGYHQEMSLRILLLAASTAAGRHRRSIKPVLSVSVDHYVRVFVRVFSSPKAALAAARDSVSYVLQSKECPSFFLLRALPRAQQPKPSDTSPRLDPENISADSRDTRGQLTGLPVAPSPGGTCPETGGTLILGGPIWSGHLHDQEWVDRATALMVAVAPGRLDGGGDDMDHGALLYGDANDPNYQPWPRPRLVDPARAEFLLRAVSQELPDVPLFYNLRDMFATIGLARSPQKDQVKGALEAAGYRTSGMHNERLALKTDAPDAAVWDVLRCWIRDNPQPPPVRPSGASILAQAPHLISNATFDFPRGEKACTKGGGKADSDG